MEFFYEKYTGTPLLDRMGAVMDYFIDEVETLRGRSLNDEEQEIICRKFMNMYVTRDICQIYNWFLEDYGSQHFRTCRQSAAYWNTKTFTRFSI